MKAVRKRDDENISLVDDCVTDAGQTTGLIRNDWDTA